jgi:hypothetical protein
MKIHRDRSSNAVRAAKDSPPLRGRPENETGENFPRMFSATPGGRGDLFMAGCVRRLDRAACPAFTAVLPSRLLRPITTTSGIEYGP